MPIDDRASYAQNDVYIADSKLTVCRMMLEDVRNLEYEEGYPVDLYWAYVMGCWLDIDFSDDHTEQEMDDVILMIRESGQYLGDYEGPENAEHNLSWVLDGLFDNLELGKNFFEPVCDPFVVWRAPLYGGAYRKAG